INLHLDPARGLFLFPLGLGAIVDPSLSPEAQDEMEYGGGLQNKLLVDATVDWTTHPRIDEWGGNRLSPNCNEPSPEIAELVQRRWEEYGFKA
ncbi:MAG: hypothetical protein DRI01_10860, partial [Chloroflexi bacterium]